LNPTTGLGGSDVGAFVRFLQRFIILILVPLLIPFFKILSTPKRAARVITRVVINASGQTGVYYDEGGHPMLGSALVRDRSSKTASSPRRAPCWRRLQNEM
jgi:hypothetical protein